MKAGDLLLMPNGDDIYFGKISSDYYFDPSVDNDKDGYPHQRKAKWLKNTSRKELSKDLRLSSKVHRTSANLSHHFTEIDALIHDKEIPVATPVSTDTIDVSYPLRPNYNGLILPQMKLNISVHILHLCILRINLFDWGMFPGLFVPPVSALRMNSCMARLAQ